MTVYPTFTKVFKFIKQAFDTSTWHDGVNSNFDKIDAILATSGLISIDGTWKNSTIYAAGAKIGDSDEGSLWRCLIPHTSPATDTFAAFRALNPLYWGQIFNGLENRESWATDTVYSHGDIVSQSGSSYLCNVSHTSGTFSLDLAAEYWSLLAAKGDPGATGPGSGNVIGPVSSTTGSVAVYSDTTGTNLDDSGVFLTDFAPIANPAFTGVPTAPTAAPGTNTTQLATTAFVQSGINALLNSAPGALDTLNELATALGDDPAFSATVTAALATKWSDTFVHGLTSKTTPTGNDELGILDSANAFASARLTLTNLLSWIWSSLGAKIAGGTGKTAPVGADMIAIADSEASNATKFVTITNLLAVPQSQVTEVLTKTASYTFVLADAGGYVRYNSASAGNFTIPLNSAVAFPIKTRIDIAQIGAGVLQVLGTAGVTITSTPGVKIGAQGGGATLIKTGTDAWDLIGNLQA